MKLPTDNLYKFIPIFGLVLVGIFIYLIAMTVIQTSNQAIENRGEMEILNENVKIQNEKIEDLKRKFESVSGTTGAAEGTAEKVKDAATDLEELKDAQTKLRLSLATLRGKQIMLDVLEQRLKLFQWFSFTGLIIGFFMIFFGFSLWYWKLQRHLDKAVAKRITLSFPLELGDGNSEDGGFDPKLKE